MHRALLVPELLQNVFALLHQILYNTELARKNFVVLARTSKIFYEPAMDRLWAHIDISRGIEPMLGCVTRLHPVVYRRDATTPAHRVSTN